MLLFWFSRLRAFSISQRRLSDILNLPRCGVIMFRQEKEGTKKINGWWGGGAVGRGAVQLAEGLWIWKEIV